MTLRPRLLAACVLAGLLASTAPVAAQAVLTTGSLAAVGDVVTIPLANVASLTVQTSGTWAGAVEFLASVDGDTWTPLPVVTTAGTKSQRTTVNGVYVVVNEGYTTLRARAAVLDSGTVTITATRGYGSVVLTVAEVPKTPVALPVPLCNPVTRHLKPLGKCF